GRAPALKSVAHRADVDFGLAAARDAVQKEGRVLARLLRLVYLAERVYLGLGQAKLVARGEPRARQRVAPNFADEDFEQAATLKRPDCRGARVRGFQKFGEQHLAAPRDERLDDMPLRGCQSARAVLLVLLWRQEPHGLALFRPCLCAARAVRDRDPACARQLAHGLRGSCLTELARRLAQSRLAVERCETKHLRLRGDGAAGRKSRKLVAPFLRDSDYLFDGRVQTRGQRGLQDLAPGRGVVVAYPARDLK